MGENTSVFVETRHCARGCTAVKKGHAVLGGAAGAEGVGGASVLEMKMGFLGLWWLDLPAQAGVKPRLIIVKFKKNSVEIVSP
jgi:hypothetical protein